MKKTYYIKPNPPQATDRKIFSAKNGRGFIKNEELHLMSPLAYFVFKFSTERWYMRNDATGKDHFIGASGSPTVTLEDVSVKDASYWGSITYEPMQ